MVKMGPNIRIIIIIISIMVHEEVCDVLVYA